VAAALGTMAVAAALLATAAKRLLMAPVAAAARLLRPRVGRLRMARAVQAAPAPEVLFPERMAAMVRSLLPQFSAKKIVFKVKPELLKAIPHPTPAGRSFPDWYKKMPTNSGAGYENKEKLDMFSNFGRLHGGMTVKKCLPVRDMIGAGYIIPLWADLAVDCYRESEQLQFNWLGQTNQVETHAKFQVQGSPLEKMCWGNSAFKLVSPWFIHTAGGYSSLILPPAYHESPLSILPAVVDTDSYHEVNFPFQYTGPSGKHVIPRGTPVAQVIPFRRDEHNMVVAALPSFELQEHKARVASYMGGMYRKLFHAKKTYR
jgi:hypothetical protein